MEKNKKEMGSIKKLKNSNYILKQLSRYRKNSLFFRNLIIIICMLSVLLLVYGINFYSKIQESINQELENSNLYLLSRVKDMGTDVLKTAETIATDISIRDYTKQYTITKDESDLTAYETEVNDIVKRYTYVYDYIDSIYVSSIGENRVTDGNRTYKKEVFEDAEFLKSIDSTEDVLIISRKKKNIYPNIITIVRPVTIHGSLNNLQSDNSILGMVCVNINTENFGELLEKKEQRKRKIPGVVMISEQGRILYSSDDSQLGTLAHEKPYLENIENKKESYTYRTKADNEKLIISVEKSDYMGISFALITPASDPWEIFIQTLQYILKGMIFALLFSIIAAALIAYTSYKPIASISRVLNEDFEKDITENLVLKEKSGEMQFVMESILSNIQKNQEMEKELQERLVLLRRAMFTALQVQINPHFIYNTLENINWLAVNLAGSDNRVSSSIITLAKLMRYSLETEGYLVTIEDELKHAEQYVELLKVRYPNVFDVQWNISREILKEKIIRLTLQPLIENAIGHGIRPKREKGIIEIKGEMREEKICISVTDDGVGMPKEKIAELNDSLLNEYLLESNHVGLRNVNQRLKIVFGENYGLHIRENQNIGRGLTIELLVPRIDIMESSSEKML